MRVGWEMLHAVSFHGTHLPQIRHSASCALAWLVALWLLTGLPSELAAQRAPTIAAAANLNFALDRGREAVRAHAGRRASSWCSARPARLTRQIQDGAPFEMFLAADEEFPNQLAAAGLTRDAGVVYAVGRLVIFAPNGFAARRSTSGSTAWRAS